MFKTVEEFFDWLANHNKFSMKLHLTRIEYACKLLDNPQNKIKTIHIAGTNGKGSVVNYLSKLLQVNNYQVGIYISPYIDCFNERIQINNEYISNEDLLECANIIYPVINKVEVDLNDDMTEFEIITLLSFVYFHIKKVDYAIIEVGLGGRYDATNVINPIVMGITNISYDHMNVLGATLEKIGYEKIGIAKPNKVIFTTEENQNVLQVFNDYCKIKSCELDIVDLKTISNYQYIDNGMKFYYKDLDYEFIIPMFGFHQLKNVLLALKLYQYILNSNDILINKDYVYEALKKAKWNGRIEIISNQPLVIVDGSHNIAGVKSLVLVMKNYIDKGYRIRCVFTALKDKEINKMTKLLKSISDKLTLTSFDHYRADTALNLYNQTIDKDGIYYNEDFKDEINNSLKAIKHDELLLITGSLYFISVVKSYLKNIL